MSRDVLFPARPRKGDPEGYFTVQENLDIFAAYFRLGEDDEDEFPLTWDSNTQSFRPAPGSIVSSGDVTAWQGFSGQTRIGRVGPSAEAGISFGNPLDVTIYRFGTQELKVDHHFRIGGAFDVAGNADFHGFVVGLSGIWGERGSGGNVGLATYITGDGVDRWEALADGTLKWSDGTNPVDTSFFRFAAGRLRTPGTLEAQLGFWLPNATGVGDIALLSWVSGDSQDRFEIYADGKHWWGPGGSTAPDTNLYRSAAGKLKTDGDLIVAGTTINISNTGAVIWFGTAGGDTNLYRDSASVLKTDDDLVVGGSLTASGTLWFGTAIDTDLFRLSAGRLKTDGLLLAAQAIATKQKAGAPVDGDWSTNPPDGTIVVDSTNNKIWARVGGAWKGVVIA